jgi:hypothetical protein
VADILIQKLQRNGWPQDEPMTHIEESLLERTSGVLDDENEHTVWTEWRLDGKIVKRGVHVTLKKNVAAEAFAAKF